MKMSKKSWLNITCGALLIAIIGVIIFAKVKGLENYKDTYSDGIEQIDPNTIYFGNSGVEVNFSEVLLSKQNETRILKVSEQEATVSIALTDRLIQGIDWDIFKKTQKVTYQGKGSFVVDLNAINQSCLSDDKEKHILTIKINHARLDTIEIDPNKIMIDAVNVGLLNWGDITLTVNDYNAIEKEIRSKLEEKFNTVKNGQVADDIAKRMVKDTYEPIVKAIDKDYTVEVKFLGE